MLGIYVKNVNDVKQFKAITYIGLTGMTIYPTTTLLHVSDQK